MQRMQLQISMTKVKLVNHISARHHCDLRMQLQSLELAGEHTFDGDTPHWERTCKQYKCNLRNHMRANHIALHIRYFDEDCLEFGSA